MTCAQLSVGEILVLIGALVLFIGVMLFWIQEAQARRDVRLMRAKRGLFAHPDSFMAIDEQFEHRRRRPVNPPPAPPRGPRQ